MIKSDDVDDDAIEAGRVLWNFDLTWMTESDDEWDDVAFTHEVVSPAGGAGGPEAQRRRV